MKKDNLCLTLMFFFTISILVNTLTIVKVYPQSFECDNNFEECGTPDQSGGGGGGGGSILIANTDLGDSYQHADDFDDDGIEDPSDNCMRFPNPQQLDRDGDGVGDSCDNCLFIHNPYQENMDGDPLGDYCDDDMDGDTLLNSEDECPFMYGNSFCFEEVNREQPHNSEVYTQPVWKNDVLENHTNELDDKEGCCQGTFNQGFNFIWITMMTFLVISRKRE